jgi:hypothetical protein
VCFAGVAPGEVLDPSRAKLVGISQRRSRAGARFQCVVHHRFDAERIVRLLGDAVPVGERRPLVAALATAVATVDVGSDGLVAALVDALATPVA